MDITGVPLDAGFRRHGQPAIGNTGQSVPFTAAAFVETLTARNIRISMDGKGARRGSVVVARLWRTVKYAEIDLKAWKSVPEVRGSITRHLA